MDGFRNKTRSKIQAQLRWNRTHLGILLFLFLAPKTLSDLSSLFYSFRSGNFSHRRMRNCLGALYITKTIRCRVYIYIYACVCEIEWEERVFGERENVDFEREKIKNGIGKFKARKDSFLKIGESEGLFIQCNNATWCLGFFNRSLSWRRVFYLPFVSVFPILFPLSIMVRCLKYPWNIFVITE